MHFINPLHRTAFESEMQRRREEKAHVEVFILRHGDAGAPLDDPEADGSRPLTRKGRQEIETIARALPKLGVELDLVITSPLTRALQTAEIIARRYRSLNRLEQWNELKPQGDTEKLFERLSRQKKGTNLLMVGHEPKLSSIVGQIVAGNSNVNIVLKKAGLARIDILGFKPKTNGELRWLLTPRIIKQAGK